MLRRLRESTFSNFVPLHEASLPRLSRGIGTPEAEYAQEGPYHCEDCAYIVKASPQGLGLCNEFHMLRDVKRGKMKGSRQGLAVVNLEHGCCRFHLDKGKKQ